MGFCGPTASFGVVALIIVTLIRRVVMQEVPKEINETVARITAAVLQEMKTNEVATFGVADFRTHLAEMSRVGENSAWEISYKTSAATINPSAPVANAAREVAWEISYKTSRVDIVKGIDAVKK